MVASDPRLEHWLDQFENWQRSRPSITADEFLEELGTLVPEELHHDLRRAINDLDWIAGVLDRMKGIEPKTGKQPPRLDSTGPEHPSQH